MRGLFWNVVFYDCEASSRQFCDVCSSICIDMQEKMDRRFLECCVLGRCGDIISQQKNMNRRLATTPWFRRCLLLMAREGSICLFVVGFGRVHRISDKFLIVSSQTQKGVVERFLGRDMSSMESSHLHLTLHDVF